jgi:PAS domain-containing protein
MVVFMDGVCERDSYRTMAKTKRTEHVTHASGDMLMRILETLPDALFAVDDDATIVYANTSAQTMTDATSEALCGKSFWRGAPQLPRDAQRAAIFYGYAC